MNIQTEGSDYMVRAMAANEEVRAFAVTSRNVVEEGRRAHGTSQVCTAALGRTLSAALMMADMLTDDDAALTIQFDCDGPIGGITVTADNNGNVKGYVKNPLVMMPPRMEGYLNVGAAVGNGTLTVIRDIDRDHTYNGQVAIHSGEIADDLTHYFAESEQVPSIVDLGTLMHKENHSVLCAGGFIIQLMPFASEEVISRLETNAANLAPIGEMLWNGMSPEDILKEALSGFDVEFTGRKPVQWHCNCSRDRVERVLKLMGPAELDDMIREGKDVELSCQFCGKKYQFTPSQLRQLRSTL